MAETRVEAWDRMERENAALRAALAPFARLADKPLGFAAVEYTVRGDPERQTFNAPQLQRSFNRAAEVYRAHHTLDAPPDDWLAAAIKLADQYANGDSHARLTLHVHLAARPAGVRVLGEGQQ